MLKYLSLVQLKSVEMEICGKWMETRVINLGERRAFLDQFRFKLTKLDYFLTLNKTFYHNKTEY